MAEVIAVVTDLIFQTKIRSTAEALGVPLQCARNPDKLREKLVGGATRLVLIDLNADGDPLASLAVARQASPPPRTVCFLSHVRAELAAAARAAGADEVMPRSAFSSNLPEILRSIGTAADDEATAAGD